MHAKVLAYVPSAIVKRAKWISKIIEFDIEVNPTKLVRGQGLAKIMVKENCELMGINFTCVSSSNLQTEVVAEVVQDQNDIQQVAENLSSCEWYLGIIHFL